MKRIGSFLIAVALIAGMVGCGGGSGNGGTASQNLEIYDWYDLDAVRNNLAGNHTLMNDLDSTSPGYMTLASSAANEGQGWQPIGTQEEPFTGTFDGQGYEIKDLCINRPEEGLVGLFCWVGEGGIITNVGVVDVDVTGAEGFELSAAALVGYNDAGTVSNCYATGSVTSNRTAGGLVGINVGSVSNSYSAVTVAGLGGVGGLVGANSGLGMDLPTEGEGSVSNCYATGNVTGDNYVGGLVGVNGGPVTNSYATGNVTGNLYVGGLVGHNYDSGTVTNSFWDTETSGQDTSDGGTGRTTAQLKNITTFSGAGWNIVGVANPDTRNPSYIWNIVDEETYPFLSWEPVA